ncbi:hypothetical protein OAO59_03525 [Gammaproteobacteria bacterium]|nr:hypothetical protein [Gammaproteobacteria bacterium]
MKKIKLLVVKPNDSIDTIYKNLVLFLENQGIKIKRGANEK